MKKPLFLIDGYSLIYRSYFAFIRRPLRNPRGRNSSAVFGFFRILFAIFKEYDPKYLAVVMDSRVPTFRHKKYLEYKATREKAPDDLHEQIPVIENILKALSVKSIRKDGYEADDIIATLSGECRREGRECFIVSGDKDLLQLVKGKTRMLKPEKGSYINIGPKEVREIWGVGPDQIHDYLSLVGDSSDNIPGVTGIGAKTAAKLLQQFGSMTSIYENLGNITSKSQREKLENGKENAQLSYELVELQENTPIEAGPEDFSVEKLDVESAAPLFLDEGMKSLVEEFGIQTSKYQVETEKPKPGEYHLVTDEQSLQSWKETVKKAGICAFDAETDSLDSLQARPVGFSIAVKSGEACYIPLQAPDTECLSEDTVKEVLKELFETDSIMVIGQNIKYDYKVLYRWGVQLKNIVFDTMIAAWLLDTTLNSYNMDALAERELGYTTVHYSDIVA
ncbi:MAG: 5'-3' exonuclease H3TH domain-containing protein [Spirochaetia bacterium]